MKYLAGSRDPFVSIVIPAFDVERTIAQGLSALLDQTYPPNAYEIIVVDDGSNDHTVQLVKEIQASTKEATTENKAPAIRLFAQANQGPAAARNLGAAHSSGEFVLFTDADCVPHQEWVEQMAKPLASGEAEGVMGRYETHQGGIVARLAQLEFEQRYDRLRRYRYIDVAFTYTAGFKRRLFTQLGGFDPSFTVANNEDTDFSYRFAEAGYRIVFNPKAVVFHPQNDTLYKYYGEKFWRAYWRMVVYRRYPQKMLKDTYTSQSLKVQIVLTYLALASLGGMFLLGASLFGYVALGIFFLFLLTTIPAALFNSTYDFRLGWLTPLFFLGRAVVMGLGVSVGTVASWKTPTFASSMERDRIQKEDVLP
jgi:glycosyltransferase involved in cell wall biosynthesis